MFNSDFYPTPPEVIQRMTDGLQIEGKVILEPSAGSGRIVEYLQAQGAKQVIACENDKYLKPVKGEVVSYNHQHGFFVVAYPDGGIISVASTVDIMLQRHPKKEL